jgi:SNF2 family DNA or RNA helicase
MQVIDCPELITAFRELNKLPSLEHRLPPPHPSPSDFRPITSSKESKSGLSLRPYQIAGLNFLVNSWYNHRNAILADEMGLGKTVQALSFLEHLCEKESVHGPFLVVAPLSTMPHWEREVSEWTDLRALTFFGTKTRRRLKDRMCPSFICCSRRMSL